MASRSSSSAPLLPRAGGGWEEGAASHEVARRLRQNATETEGRLWQRVRAKQLAGLHFRRQHPIGPYIVDFACLTRHLVIELDGGQHALCMDRDQARTAWLESQGLTVLRFWNNDLLENIEGVVSAILRYLER